MNDPQKLYLILIWLVVLVTVVVIGYFALMGKENNIEKEDHAGSNNKLPGGAKPYKTAKPYKPRTFTAKSDEGIRRNFLRDEIKRNFDEFGVDLATGGMLPNLVQSASEVPTELPHADSEKTDGDL